MAEHSLKYYHIDHKTKWQCVPEEEIPAEAKYESVLYVKYRAEDVEASGEEQEYWGPFYIDIDVDTGNELESIAEALADLRDIVTYLKREFGIVDTDLRLYASGGKGFHLELNPYLYMNSSFKTMLPLRYRALANRIIQATNVKNIDMGVYSQGKGRQWRRVNVKRENGRYKNYLSSLDGLTVAAIVELTKTPGPIPPVFNKGKVNPLLGSWFSSTKKIVELIKVSEPVPDETLRKIDTPECVVKLASNTDIKTKVNSNLLAMQAISFGIAKGWSIDQIVSYNSRFINNYRSSQYRTPAAFEDHFRALYDYAAERPEKFKFGCKMMLACVGGDIDCNACAVRIGESEESHGNIYVKDGGYWLIQDNPDLPHKQLTNFTLKWLKKITKEDGTQRLLFKSQCISSPEKDKLIEVDSEAFLTRASFGKITGMYEVFYGTDKEAMMLKLGIAHLGKPIDMREVNYTGLVWLEDEWHYVTKEGSVSLAGTIDLIKANVDISLANDTRLNFSAEEPRPDEIIRVLDALFDMNEATYIVPMIAWFFNAFFSPHTQFTNETSPSLFVTGLHGSGKTQTMIQLHRLFAPSKPAFPSISATTAFSMNKYASGTNLMPLIFDEFKPTANKGRNNEAGQVSQAIRSSYNKAFESRGTQTREIDQTPFYAPLAIIGEQQLNEGAIADRIILVQMDKHSHSPKNTAALEAVKELAVEKVGALFLEYAMRVTPKEYTNAVLTHDKNLELEFGELFDSRPRRNLANLRTALDFLESFVTIYTGDTNLITKISEKRVAYFDSFKRSGNEIYQELKNTDDIAAALNQLNDLADLLDSSIGDLMLMPNRHYRTVSGVLYLDLFAVYKLLSLYVQKFKLDLYLTDKTSFMAQLSHKRYVTVKPSKSDIITQLKQRVIIGIDLKLAAADNITLDNFKD